MLQSTLGGKDAEVALYHLTRAYQALADHTSREMYDQSLGLNVESLPRVPLTRRSSWIPFSSPRRGEVEPDIKIDYYEVMRLDSAAHLAVVGEAYAVMRNHYLRLAEQGQARAVKRGPNWLTSWRRRIQSLLTQYSGTSTTPAVTRDVLLIARTARPATLHLPRKKQPPVARFSRQLAAGRWQWATH